MNEPVANSVNPAEPSPQPALVVQPQAPAQGPVVPAKTNPFLWFLAGLLVLVMIMQVLIMVKKDGQPSIFNTLIGSVSGGSSTTPPTTPAGGDVTASTHKGGFIRAQMCTLMSDGTHRRISDQVNLYKAQEAFNKHPGNKQGQALIESLKKAAEAIPAHTVIAELPKSELPPGMDCDDWNAERAYKLVLGAPKPQKS